jgi:Xaa-Pro aminopeptidase
MVKAGLDAFLICDRHNSYYFSQFPCSNSIIIAGMDSAFFLTDFRYLEKASECIRDFEVRRMTQNATDELQAILRTLKSGRIGFEGDMSYNRFLQFGKALGTRRLVEMGSLVADLRAVKDNSEIAQIAENQKLNEKVLSRAIANLSLGEREDSIKRRIRLEMTERGVEEAFDTIVAAGEKSSLPHAIAGASKVRAGKYLLIDMGVKNQYYHSDMTRTFGVGKVTTRHRQIYDVVLEAQQAALQKIRPGARCRDIDAAARGVIEKHGYGEYFGHGLGHGVGLEIHEGPTLNPRSESILRAGMVVTVEPGIYLPGFGGVRIEDLVVVTKSGYDNLTSAKKNFKTLLA